MNPAPGAAHSHRRGLFRLSAQGRRHSDTRYGRSDRYGDTVALSGGTTTTEIIRSLKVLSGITIVTNSINVAMELSSRSDIDVIVTGGYLRGNWFTLVGPLATASADLLFADIMFIGVDGIDVEQGLTCTNSAEVDFLRHLAQHSKRRVVVADHTKIGVTAKMAAVPSNGSRPPHHRSWRTSRQRRTLRGEGNCSQACLI